VGDAQAIAALEALGTTPSWNAQSVAATIELPTTEGWVVEQGAVVAHLITTRVDDEAEVLILATHPDHRRRGLAHALLTHAANHWRSSRVRRAFLDVRSDNTAARTLYGRAGWIESGRRPHYYRDGTDAVLLQLVIDP
jgi:ribosomal-protein-alanine N-acetyltransferase